MEGVGHYRGARLGLATGDALGAPVEGMPLGIEDIIGGGIQCLAESLVEKRGFNSIDQLGRYLRWFREGYFSCRGSASA